MAATGNGAYECDLADELGTIEVDRIADIIVLDEDQAENPEIVARLRDAYAQWSRHCDVLPVSELKIEEIPDDKKPLTREPDEMHKFLKTVNSALRKQKLPTFQEDEQ